MDTQLNENNFSIVIENKEIVAVRVNVGRYSSASITVAPSKDEFFDMYYEWSGEDYIPGFVLEVLSYVKSKNEKADFKTKDGFVYKNEELYKSYLEFKNRGE